MTNGKQKKSADGRPTHYSPTSSLLPSTIKPCKWLYLKIGTTLKCLASFQYLLLQPPQPVFARHHVVFALTNVTVHQFNHPAITHNPSRILQKIQDHESFPLQFAVPWFFLQIIFRLEKLSAPELLRFDVKGKFRTIYHPLEAGNDLEKEVWCGILKHHICKIVW